LVQEDSQPGSHTDEVPLVDQPYRTTPLVLPHAKTIHETLPAANFLQQHPEAGQEKPYRNSTVSLPAPRTLNDLACVGTAYQQYRGPQFNTQMTKPVQKPPSQLPFNSYNSPAPLYSQDNLTEAVATHPGFVQNTKPSLPSASTATLSKPHESDTFRLILESEIGTASDHAGVGGRQFERQHSGQSRPTSQQSDRSSEHGRPSLDPVMRNSSINQSASFKKVMYSVMGETEF